MVKGTGYRTLCAAVAGGDADALRRAAAADPEAARHWKPVMDASFAGRADMIAALLDADANPNATAGTPGRHTPLIRAMQPHETIAKHAGHDAAVEVRWTISKLWSLTEPILGRATMPDTRRSTLRARSGAAGRSLGSRACRNTIPTLLTGQHPISTTGGRAHSAANLRPWSEA